MEPMLSAYTGNRPALPLLLQDLMHHAGDGVLCCVAFPGSSRLEQVEATGDYGCLLRSLVPYGRVRALRAIGLVRPTGLHAGENNPGSLQQDPHATVAVGFSGCIENLEDLTKTPMSQPSLRPKLGTGYLVERITACLKKTGCPEDALEKALDRTQGCFALICLRTRGPAYLLAASRGVPLFIGQGRGETFVSTDPRVVLAHGVEVNVVRNAVVCCDQLAAQENDAAQRQDQIPFLREPLSCYRAPRLRRLDLSLAAQRE